MTDLAAFAEEGFDPKAWINAACAGKPPDEPLERFLAELEMRLQLGGEEIEVSLTECSTSALRRVPFAQQEVSRLRGDVTALQVSTKGLLSSVAADAEAAAASAAPLAALHTARSNMEAGCATLREAAELSGAFKRVEEVFAAGDLPRVADMLRSMAKSLALVGDVPEFREGRSKLAALEDRLQRRVEGRLADALQANAGPEVSSLASLLLAVGRYNSLEAAYVNSRMALISGIWDEAAALLASGTAAAPAGGTGAAAGSGAGGLGGGWLLLLYNNLMALLEGDAAWLASCLPGQQRQLLVAVTTAAFEKLNKSVRDKLSAPLSTRILAGLLGDVLVATKRLRELLAAALPPTPGGGAPAAAAGGDDAALVKLLKLVLDPIEQQMSRYTALEEPVISASLFSALPISPSKPTRVTGGPAPGPAASGASGDAGEPEELEPDVAQKLSAACSSAFTVLFGVLERCILLTGGTEFPPLLTNLDKQVAGYLQRMQAAVGIITGRYSRLAAASSPAADITIMLQLVLVARHVSSRLNTLETHLRSTLAKAIPRLQGLAAAGLPPLGLPPPAAAAGAAQGQQHAQHNGQHQHQHASAGSSSSNTSIPAAAAAAAAELLPLRLAAFPNKLQPLNKLQAAAAGSRFMSLPAATVAGSQLCEAISAAVYDALLAPVVASLAQLASLPEWAGSGGTGVAPGAGAVVPSFSAYPLAAMTAVGEYLMALPQQLEVLMADEAAAADSGSQEAAAALHEEADGDELAAEWLDKVVRGAGLLYADTLLHIKSLSPSGAAQLAADAEYFCNVMSALAVAPSPALITAQLFAAAPADTFEQMANGAVAAGSADVKVLKAIAAMRGITWSEEAATAAAAAAGGEEARASDAAAAAAAAGVEQQLL